MVNRRSLLMGAAAVPALAQTGGAKNIVIASSNGERACAKAMEILRTGGDTLDAVVAGVNINEEDPADDSVGYGGLPNEEGVVELDACVMHGPTRRAGSVASIRGIKTPSKIAKLIMEQTDHIMLVGDNALRFAKAFGFKEENLLTEKSRLAWLVWKQSLRDPRGHNNWTDGLDAPHKQGAGPGAALHERFPGVDPELLAYAWDRAIHPPTGTINCLALNTKGEMSGTTTTSGLAWKIPGRVGDSPIIGAGCYVDQEVGAAGSTGRGEENIRVAGAHTIVENMRHGMSPKDAVMDCLKRVSRNYDHDKKRLAQFDINFYALRKDGVYAGGSLWSGQMSRGKFSPRKFAVNDGGASRLENCVYLYERS
ncbi:MAG: N(4)-(beta-N-acetylglucosaminyl)-L-asparaginase [Proteobacteria bacterium]|nr:N(4)-(beta-N-acetylglucosaminyl)-L-asparaginase [Pseudomonadota bacterium]